MLKYGILTPLSQQPSSPVTVPVAVPVVSGISFEGAGNRQCWRRRNIPEIHVPNSGFMSVPAVHVASTSEYGQGYGDAHPDFYSGRNFCGRPRHVTLLPKCQVKIAIQSPAYLDSGLLGETVVILIISVHTSCSQEAEEATTGACKL